MAKVEAAPKAAAAAKHLRTEAVQAIREARDEVLKDPELAIPTEPEPVEAPVTVGGRVRLKSMGLVGDVLSLQGDLAEVAISGKRLRVPRGELVGLGAGGRKTASAGASGRASAGEGRGGVATVAKAVPAEVNLIGLTVEEATERVDKVLDDAALSDRREIRLVHGFGEGKLRKAVARLLEKHPLVSSWRLGGPSEGGGGATVVELKD